MKGPYRPPPTPRGRIVVEALKLVLMGLTVWMLQTKVRPAYCAHVIDRGSGFPAVVCGE